MTPTQTPLDEFISELHRAAERNQSSPVAVALSPYHIISGGKPPSIYGLATCYDKSLSVSQGFLFFDTLEAFNRYRAKVNP